MRVLLKDSRLDLNGSMVRATASFGVVDAAGFAISRRPGPLSVVGTS